MKNLNVKRRGRVEVNRRSKQEIRASILYFISRRGRSKVKISHLRSNLGITIHTLKKYMKQLIKDGLIVESRGEYFITQKGAIQLKEDISLERVKVMGPKPGLVGTKRRSRFEVLTEILEYVLQQGGSAKPTRIMYGTNLSWVPLGRHIGHLVEQGLLRVVQNVKVHPNDKIDRRSKNFVEITDKGRDFCYYVRKAHKGVGII